MSEHLGKHGLDKPKVLVVGAFPPPGSEIAGGVVTACRRLLNSSFGASFELVLIDTTQISNPPPKLGHRLVLAARRFFSFAAQLFTSRPDAVLLFVAAGASIAEKGAMAWLCRLIGTPSLLFSRASEHTVWMMNASEAHRWWVQACLQGGDYLLCQGEGFASIAQERLGFPPNRTLVIENWSATREMLAVGEQREPGASAVPTLLYLAWIVKEKGIFELIDAVKSLSQRYPFHLVVAGGGLAEAQAKAHVMALGLQDRVRFVGWVDDDEKDRWLKQADVLVHPSWGEGFPNAVIEAMAAKLAVLVTTVGAVPDLLTDRQEALLIPPKNVEALCGAIETLLVDHPLRWQLAERGHAFARERFSVEVGAIKLTQAIEKAIAENNAKPKGLFTRLFRRQR